MTAVTVLALVLALVSTTLTNLAYLREHDAAAAMPALSLRHPLHSVRELVTDRTWMSGFALEGGGFALYVAALAIAPLTLVQAVAAGGIAILAFAAARFSHRRLTRRELAGVLFSVGGLVALAVSLSRAVGEGSGGSVGGILVWLGATAAAAIGALLLGRRSIAPAVAFGVAGGLFFSIGDISVKVATEGGSRTAFGIGVVVGYGLGTAFLQLGYQKGGALTVAGIATLLTNALPIAAGTVVLAEPVPTGALGAVRIVAFAAVCIGAFLLAKPASGSSTSTPAAQEPV